MKKKTEQENFWAGNFGDEYIERNSLEQNLGAATAMWAKILSKCHAPITSILEIGCNIGINLCALARLMPDINLEGIEINQKAAYIAKKNTNSIIHTGSILDISLDKKFDMVFSCGVLIHINPDSLPLFYKKMNDLSQAYICISEYYNPTPIEIPYREHRNKLFKRDFAGEMMDIYPDLSLLDYSFIYHRDPIFPRDDITWFLIKK